MNTRGTSRYMVYTFLGLLLLGNGCSATWKAYYNRGVEWYDQQFYTRAITEYQKAIVANPEVIPPRFNLAIAYTEKGMIPQAITEYQEILKRFPHHTESLINLATIYEQQSEFSLARDYLERAIRSAPHQAYPYTRLGLFYEKRGQEKLAMAAYQLALSRNPAHADTHYFLGRLLAKHQQIEEAIHHYKLAIEGGREDSHVYYALAQLYQDQGNLAQATRALEKAYLLQPENLQTAIELGLVYIKQHQHDLALKLYQSLQAQGKNQPEIQQQLRQLSQALSAHEGANRMHSRPPEKKPLKNVVSVD